jgi:glycosyltransferase involved in cell wall biosynthesis
MRILYLTDWFPFPPDNGIKIRILSLLKALAKHHLVDLVSFTREPPTDAQFDALRPYCRNVLTQAYRTYSPRRLDALLGFLSPSPRSVVSTYSPAMAAAVKQAAAQFASDVVIAEELGMAPYALAVPDRPRLLEGLELSLIYDASRRPGPLPSRLRRRLTWIKHGGYVRRTLRHFAACTVASPTEQALAREVAPGMAQVAVVPNGTDLERNPLGTDLPEPDSLVYSGALTFQSNFDAVDYFLRKIFPLVLAQRPGARLRITGGLTGVPTAQLPQHAGVTFTGYLDDVRPVIAASMVNIVPLRSGGGTRLKILESLALGTPVVATPKGVQGLELIPGRDLLVAERPADFAEAVLSLLANPALRETLRHNGRKAVEARYDFAKIGESFCGFMERVVAETAAQAQRARGASGKKIEPA